MTVLWPITFTIAFVDRLIQYAWLPVLRVLGTQEWSGRLLWVSGAMDKVDDQGDLTDDGMKSQLKKYTADYTAFTRRMKA